MIYFPEIDLKEKNIMVIIFVLSMLIIYFQYFDTNVLLSILIILYIINEFPSLKKNVQKNILSDKTEYSYNYNHKISEILKKLKKYKKKEKQSFHQGMYYWSKFIKTLHILEDDKLYHYNQYFDNAQDYLQKSVNYFQSIGTSIQERKLIDGLKYNDFENSKNTMKITKLSKDLYQEGYLLLYNLSLRLNKRWEENPNIYNKQIILDHPFPYDNNNDPFNFYL